ncbi:PAS domain-containing hybrid sensor histidine kinase/response regulator [Caldimonas caldifontis]|nr:PAS domain-containing hybrid sensor histidine kinase/response regulator [Caldimonas caldifontis]
MLLERIHPTEPARMNWGSSLTRLMAAHLGVSQPQELAAWLRALVLAEPAGRAEAVVKLQRWIEAVAVTQAELEASLTDARIEQRDAERLRLAMDSVNDAFWDWDVANGEAYFSPRLLEILGYAPGEIEMTLALWREHMHTDDREEARVLLEAHLRGETARYQGEFRVRSRDGQWRWVRSRGKVIERGAQGQPLRMVGTHSDVTQQRQAEEEVLHQLRFIEELVEIIPNPIYFKDALGRYIGCNRACEDLFGLRREDFLGRMASEVLGTEGATEESHDQHLFATGGVQTFETQLRSSSGEQRELIHSRTLFTGAQGHVGGILGVITDITQHKQVEVALRDAKAAAEAASRAKSEFLANMSHEIRTPMNGIMGLVDLTLDTALDDTQRRYLSLVKSSSTSLLNILNDILDLSRIEAGRLSVEQLGFDLRSLLHEALAPLEPRAREKQLVLQCTVAPDVPAQLVSDPLRLRQILVNLVGNAIKFTRQGRVDLTAWPEGRGSAAVLHLCVADTGVGIAPDKLDRIFESFTQADNSTTREYGGTGLGLTISRRLAQALGGQLWAESEVGVGSRFHLTVPLLLLGAAADGGRGEPSLTEAAAGTTNVSRDKARSRFESTAYLGLAGLDADAEEAPAEGDEHGLHVLLVDDHAVNRFIASRMIRASGHRVSGAVTAEEALSRCESEEFDLIFLDLQIPGMSGIELTHRIRALQAQYGWRCPIVALTAHAMPMDRARCMDAGMDDYLTKPVDQERLHSLLRLVASARLLPAFSISRR